MLNYKQVKQIFQKIKIIRPPKRRLTTFGTSDIRYKLITDIPGLPDRSRLRVGRVTAEKPLIITPQALKEQFFGFGPEANDYIDLFLSHYGKALRGLEYQFRNEPLSMGIELVPPEELAKKLIEEFDKEDGYQNTLIQGTDKLWELSVMKFIIEETLASFPANFQELQERGFFDGEARLQNTREREILNLFQKAEKDRDAIPYLARKLKEYELFEAYQDRFFRLVNP